MLYFKDHDFWNVTMNKSFWSSREKREGERQSCNDVVACIM